jgi:hypothetical protein
MKNTNVAQKRKAQPCPSKTTLLYQQYSQQQSIASQATAEKEKAYTGIQNRTFKYSSQSSISQPITPPSSNQSTWHHPRQSKKTLQSHRQNKASALQEAKLHGKRK